MGLQREELSVYDLHQVASYDRGSTFFGQNVCAARSGSVDDQELPSIVGISLNFVFYKDTCYIFVINLGHFI